MLVSDIFEIEMKKILAGTTKMAKLTQKRLVHSRMLKKHTHTTM